MSTNDGTILGDFYNVMQILEVAPSLRLLNHKGEYRDRYRYDMNDAYSIQLDVALRSRLTEYPIKALSDFIWHLKQILEDAEQMKQFLIDNGVEEEHTTQGNHITGLNDMGDKLYSKVYDLIAVDPLGFKEKLKEKHQDIMLMRNGKTLWKVLQDFTTDMVNSGVKK
jgi:hypothetical protein